MQSHSKTLMCKLFVPASFAPLHRWFRKGSSSTANLYSEPPRGAGCAGFAIIIWAKYRAPATYKKAQPRVAVLQQPTPQISVGGALGLNLHVQAAASQVGNLIRGQFDRAADRALLRFRYC